MLTSNDFDLSWSRAFRFMLQIAAGMSALHERSPPIFHRDFNSLNVLVTKDFDCKVADFGLSRINSAENLDVRLRFPPLWLFFTYKTLQELRGTSQYVAPEVVGGLDGVAFQYVAKSDVFR